MWYMLCDLWEDWPGKLLIFLISSLTIGIIILVVSLWKGEVWWSNYKIIHDCELIQSTPRLRNTITTQVISGPDNTLTVITLPSVQSYNENCYKCSNPDTIIWREE